ncbi:B-zip transcription factor [Aspergillus sp. HF37]|nr:B-zip transcription factor [Aspergillus sp. HF37]
MDYSYYSSSHPRPFSPYGLHSLPTPDHSQTPRNGGLEDAFSALNNYNSNNFGPSLRFDPASFVPPPHSPPRSISSNGPANNPADPIPADGAVDGQPAVEQIPGRSSSEEKDGVFLPKSRRKEQNRAAQRAFRERKERRVRDLEEKVSGLENASITLQAENERLRHELAKSATENEVLRATSSPLRRRTPSSSSRHRRRSEELEPATATPMATSFFSRLIPEGEPARRHRVAVSGTTGERLLDAGSTWDLIQGHELFERGAVDIADVCVRLKRNTQCDGQGPAFKEGDVRRAIEECAARGSGGMV